MNDITEGMVKVCGNVVFILPTAILQSDTDPRS